MQTIIASAAHGGDGPGSYWAPEVPFGGRYTSGREFEELHTRRVTHPLMNPTGRIAQ